MGLSIWIWCLIGLAFILGLGIGCFVMAWVVTRNPNYFVRFFDNMDDIVEKGEKKTKTLIDDAAKSQATLSAMKAARDAFNAVVNGVKK